MRKKEREEFEFQVRHLVDHTIIASEATRAGCGVGYTFERKIQSIRDTGFDEAVKEAAISRIRDQQVILTNA